MSAPPSASGDRGPEPRAQWHQAGAAGNQAQPPPGEDGWWNLFESAAVSTPRGKRSRRPLMVVGVVLAVVVGSAVMVWSNVGSRDSSTPSAAQPPTSTTAAVATAAPRLLAVLPAGVARERCRAAEPAAELRLAIVCDGSGAPGEPTVTAWSGAENRSTLDAAFQRLVASSTVVVCPGNIQSPGPWRRNAQPQTPVGTLLCAFRDGKPFVAWTDDDRLLLAVAEGRSAPKPLEPLYRWWTTHS